MLIADGKPFVTALLFAENAVLQRTLSSYQNSERCASPQDANYCVMKTLQTHIDALNESLNGWEKIGAFRYISEELNIESGLLTPTMKLCRSKVTEHYSMLIDSMYGEAAEVPKKENI